MMFRSGRLCEWTLSKFFCFLSNAAQAAFDLSMSLMRSSTSPCSLCFVFSSEAHFELTASICSSDSCRRWASFFLQDETVSTERKKILTFLEDGQEGSLVWERWTERATWKAMMVWTEGIDRSLGWHSTLELCIGWENTYPRGRLHQCGEEPETHFQYWQCKECDFSTVMVNSIVDALEFSFL